jgi:hypothetical protein
MENETKETGTISFDELVQEHVRTSNGLYTLMKNGIVSPLIMLSVAIQGLIEENTSIDFIMTLTSSLCTNTQKEINSLSNKT